MTTLTLQAAQTIVATALDHCRAGGFKPMGVVVLDARGALKAAAIEDGSALKRSEIAHGKAYGALALGIGSRSIFKRAKEQAFFVASVSHVAGGALVPVPGGVLIRDAAGEIVGAVGISGDTSDNDEAAALAGIAAAGLTGDPGQD
ncbi:GlcG/HbpS family heme-binding protein [Ancylobacter lacus]|uniref:GlcG/HbpS family heme-binding protein n=1 Tax=Ancylobacter lacus TaxID=2579970 RepID=UPI001BD0FC46|nr:heme-binding protein [Ancylobacter lacus]MBS7537808.1 heme-binding protein [Ancylobacter lacus]